MDKYGVGQDPYCYAGTPILRNLLGIRDDPTLEAAERDLTVLTAEEIQFAPPPYELDYLKSLHHQLFSDLYPWAGEIRTIDIAKGETRFCNVQRIEPEAGKLFTRLKRENYFTDLPRDQLVSAVAEFYGDLNVVHPFREGNGRTQRMLFEHLVINVGYEISWEEIQREEWLHANIAAYYCDYDAMIAIFDRCIGQPLDELPSDP
ncbi:cell filamentation protein [Modicisalibacter muralis]|uniref:protein adenylyltransferase n=1 Tax=Modicisalibacter muralis TaxID=119000 RepID=A0A1G9RWN4_9GAMM|nr:putative adenosine monophosphate-protein transferase Fic [Halomonas muralis]SDM27430.1 cell filamentation protein [Halomonas muralis]